MLLIIFAFLTLKFTVSYKHLFFTPSQPRFCAEFWGVWGVGIGDYMELLLA